MGKPVFTEAELRRAMTVAAEFSADVEVNPRLGTIRLSMPSGSMSDKAVPKADGENECDRVFGL